MSGGRMGRVTALMSSVMDLHVRIALQEVGKEKRRVIGGGIFLAMGVGLASMASLALQLALILWIRERSRGGFPDDFLPEAHRSASSGTPWQLPCPLFSVEPIQLVWPPQPPPARRPHPSRRAPAREHATMPVFRWKNSIASAIWCRSGAWS